MRRVKSLANVLRGRVRRSSLHALVLAVALSSAVSGQVTPARDTLHVYGPGGPLPAMKEAAAEFSRLNRVAVEVVGGPTPQWLEKAKSDADIIFSGAEHMMTDFMRN